MGIVETAIQFLFCGVLALAAAAGGYFVAALVCRMTPGGVAHAFSDIKDYFLPAGNSYEIERRIRQLEITLSSSGIIGLVNIFNVLVLTAILLSEGVSFNVIWWALAIIILSAFQLGSCMQMRGKSLSARAGRRILKRLIFNAGIFGIVWGAGATLFLVSAGETGKVLILLTLMGTAAGGVAALATVPPAAILFCSAIGGQVIFQLFQAGGEGDFAIAGLAMSLLFMMGALSSGVYVAAIKRPALKALGRVEECSGPACVTCAPEAASPSAA